MIDLLSIARTEADGGDLFKVISNMFDTTDVKPNGYPEAIVWKGGNHDQDINPVTHSLTDAYALIKSLYRYHAPLDVRILINMARDVHEAKDVFERIQKVCRKFLNVRPQFAGHVPHDLQVSMAARLRTPFALASPKCPASACINHLARNISRNLSKSSTLPIGGKSIIGETPCGASEESRPRLFFRMTQWLRG